MKKMRVPWKERVKLILSVVIALAAVELLFACDQSTDPSKDTKCGSGNVQWDVKAQVCRDLGRNVVVPASCCGY